MELIRSSVIFRSAGWLAARLLKTRAAGPGRRGRQPFPLFPDFRAESRIKSAGRRAVPPTQLSGQCMGTERKSPRLRQDAEIEAASRYHERGHMWRSPTQRSDRAVQGRG